MKTKFPKEKKEHTKKLDDAYMHWNNDIKSRALDTYIECAAQGSARANMCVSWLLSAKFIQKRFFSDSEYNNNEEEEQMLSYLHAAKELGHPFAYGILYENMKKRNLHQGFSLIEEGARLGDPLSMYYVIVESFEKVPLSKTIKDCNKAERLCSELLSKNSKDKSFAEAREYPWIGASYSLYTCMTCLAHTKMEIYMQADNALFKQDYVDAYHRAMKYSTNEYTSIILALHYAQTCMANIMGMNNYKIVVEQFNFAQSFFPKLSPSYKQEITQIFQEALAIFEEYEEVEIERMRLRDIELAKLDKASADLSTNWCNAIISLSEGLSKWASKPSLPTAVREFKDSHGQKYTVDYRGKIIDEYGCDTNYNYNEHNQICDKYGKAIGQMLNDDTTFRRY